MVLASAIRFLSVFLPVLALCALAQSSNRIETLHEQAQSAEASGDLTTAITRYKEILRLDPRLAPAYNNLGALYFKQGNLRDAVNVLRRGLKVDPRMRSASALLGMALFQMSEYKEARPSLEAAVRENPSDMNAEFLLVNDLTKLGRFEEAGRHLQQILKIEPKNQHAWYLLGKVYMQLAQLALGKVNQIDPDSVWAHEISAQLMESMNNYDGAIVQWKKAITAAPNQPGVHYQLGDLYWSHSDWDKATEQFQLEKKIDPRDCLADWKLGDILMRKGVQAQQALDLENKALAACPTLPDAHADHARLLLRLHRDREAIPELKELERADPAKPSTHFLLAKAYRATGQKQEAGRELQLFSTLETRARSATAENAQEVIKESQSDH